MKRLFTMLLAFAMAFSVTGCSKNNDKTVFDRTKTMFDTIRASPEARMELPDGYFVYVDSEIDSLRSFADLDLAAAPLEPADNEEDWLYRIVFNPSEKVSGADEIVVSFHEKYVQIDHEFYLPPQGVEFESILQWAESKFDCFFEWTAAFGLPGG